MHTHTGVRARANAGVRVPGNDPNEVDTRINPESQARSRCVSGLNVISTTILRPSNARVDLGSISRRPSISAPSRGAPNHPPPPLHGPSECVQIERDQLGCCETLWDDTVFENCFINQTEMKLISIESNTL